VGLLQSRSHSRPLSRRKGGATGETLTASRGTNGRQSVGFDSHKSHFARQLFAWQVWLLNLTRLVDGKATSRRAFLYLPVRIPRWLCSGSPAARTNLRYAKIALVLKPERAGFQLPVRLPQNQLTFYEKATSHHTQEDLVASQRVVPVVC
jgi:hypothetical protein